MGMDLGRNFVWDLGRARKISEWDSVHLLFICVVMYFGGSSKYISRYVFVQWYQYMFAAREESKRDETNGRSL
jgi:hypothetical protein